MAQPIRLSKKDVEQGVVVRPDMTISLSKLRPKLGEILNRVQYGKACVLVTNYGKNVALILPVPEE